MFLWFRLGLKKDVILLPTNTSNPEPYLDLWTHLGSQGVTPRAMAQFLRAWKASKKYLDFRFWLVSYGIKQISEIYVWQKSKKQLTHIWTKLVLYWYLSTCLRSLNLRQESELSTLPKNELSWQLFGGHTYYIAMYFT